MYFPERSLIAVGEPRKRTHLKRVVSVTVVAGITLGGMTAAAFAATPAIPGADGIIRVCVEADDVGHYNDLRFLLNGYKWCKRGEKQIFWNQKGRTGATGPKGAIGAKGDAGSQGPAGPAGVSGWEVVEVTETVSANNSTKTISAPCPAGKQAVGGGYRMTGRLDVSESAAAPGGVGWTIKALNPFITDHDVTVQVVCVSAL